MARLTETEKAVLTKAATKALKFVTGKPLAAEHRDQLFKVVQELKDTDKVAIGKEAIALWAAKIDFAIANNDKKNVSALVSAKTSAELLSTNGKLGTVAFWDSNGGCNCGGGGGPAGW